MLTNKKDAVAQIEQIKQLIMPYMNTTCTLSFDQHSFGVHITGVELGKTTGLTNAPNKRKTEDGKNKTPMIFNILTEQGTLVFVLDDTEVSPLFNGVRFQVGGMNVDLRKV